MLDFLSSVSSGLGATLNGTKTVTIQLRYQILLVVVVLAGGFGLGKYTQPTKVVTKTETVVKTVTVDHVNTVVVTKEVDKPDGTKEIDTTTTDKSVTDTTTQSDEKTDKVVTNSKAQWRVDGLYGTQIGSTTGLANGPVYGVGIERRILGPIWAGAQANSDKRVALTVGFEF
jgi:hypothetical protein